MGEEVFSISHTINALIYEKHSGGRNHISVQDIQRCPKISV